MSQNPLFSTLAIVMQIGFGMASLMLLAFAPPARGEMLLVPLANDLPVARLARDADAALIDRGPGAGLIVRGDRDALFWPLLRAGVLTMAAPVGGCGSER